MTSPSRLPVSWSSRGDLRRQGLDCHPETFTLAVLRTGGTRRLVSSLGVERGIERLRFAVAQDLDRDLRSRA